MLHDECRRLLIVGHGLRSRSMNDPDGGVAMNLKVQMRMVESVESDLDQTDCWPRVTGWPSATKILSRCAYKESAYLSWPPS